MQEFFFFFAPCCIGALTLLFLLLMSDKPIELQILDQLDAIYSKENLAKNAFFKEMTEQDPDHCKCLLLDRVYLKLTLL